MRSVVVILLAALLFPHPQLTSTISLIVSAAKTDLKLHISNKASLIVRIRLSSMLFLVGSSTAFDSKLSSVLSRNILLCVASLADGREAQVPHNNQGL